MKGVDFSTGRRKPDGASVEIVRRAVRRIDRTAALCQRIAMLDQRATLLEAIFIDIGAVIADLDVVDDISPAQRRDVRHGLDDMRVDVSLLGADARRRLLMELTTLVRLGASNATERPAPHVEDLSRRLASASRMLHNAGLLSMAMARAAGAAMPVDIVDPVSTVDTVRRVLDVHAQLDERLDALLTALVSADPAAKAREMTRALILLSGLEAALDIEQGGEAAQLLAVNYALARKWIALAVVDRQTMPIAQARERLDIIRTAWRATTPVQHPVAAGWGQADAAASRCSVVSCDR